MKDDRASNPTQETLDEFRRATHALEHGRHDDAWEAYVRMADSSPVVVAQVMASADPRITPAWKHLCTVLLEANAVERDRIALGQHADAAALAPIGVRRAEVARRLASAYESAFLEAPIQPESDRVWRELLSGLGVALPPRARTT